MNKIKELDTAKGLLIFLVVVGHAGIEDTRIIYWFHMPIFFMISGFLMNQKKIDSSESTVYILGKLIKLLVPYLSFLVLLAVLSLLFNLGGINILSWQFVLKAIIGGKLLFGQFGVFWFITCLMATIFLYAIIEKFVSSRFLKVFLVLVAFLVGHVEYYFLKSGINIVVPGNFDTALVTLCYLYTGVWFRSLMMKKSSNFFKVNSYRPLFVICISVVTLIISFPYLVENSLDLKYQKYANPLATLLIPLSFAVLIFLLCNLLVKFRLSALFTELGKQSLIIMYLHLLFKVTLVKFNLYNPYLFIVIGTILPLFISYLLQMNKYTSSIFLGNINFTNHPLPEGWRNSLFTNNSSPVSIKEGEEEKVL